MKPRKGWPATALAVLSLAILLLGMQSSVGVAAASVGVLLCAVAAMAVFAGFAPQLLHLSRGNPKLRVLWLSFGIVGVTVLGALVFALGEKQLTEWLGEQGFERAVTLFMLGVVGAVVLLFGNLAPRIPFNRYMGLRLPWTVTDEPTWRVAHRMLGWLAWPCGLLQLAVALFCRPDWLERWTALVLLPAIIWLLVPSLYSLCFFCRRWQVGPRWLYRSHHPKEEE